MKGFKQCNKGHFFNEAIEECPYCPKGGASDVGAKTEVLGGFKTQKISQNVESQKTHVFGGGTPSENSPSAAPTSNEESFDSTKTIIGGGDTGIGDAKDQNQVSRRKLRGWLVSFDIEKFGIDFRIVEGRNIIGSNASSDVTIKDGEVSSLHALVLCKKDKFIITDELSSNGTLLNGADLTPREPYDLNDGDEIIVGTTNFLFKTAFKK